MTDGGKGDKPRPFTDRAQFDDNWDVIFKAKTMTTFTTEDRIEAEKTPCVIPDRGASYIEPIPFAGLVDVAALEEELRRLRAENEELRSSGKNASNH